MYLDEKITVWQRHSFLPEDEEQVRKRLKEGASINDLYDEELLYSEETILDTMEVITPVENEGYPTIELLNDEGYTVWNNVRGEQ